MRRRPRFALLAVAIAIGTVLVTDSSAYVLSGPSWAVDNVPYYVNSANMDLPAASAETAVRAGADVWHQQGGVTFRFSFAGQSSQTAITNDGINLVVFRNAASGSAIATTYWYSSGGRIIDADIVFWDGGFQFFAGSTGCAGGFYIEDIAAHEFGHALGLGHSPLTAATMYFSVSACNTSDRTLDADDIAGVRALYPLQSQGPSAPTGFRIVH